MAKPEHGWKKDIRAPALPSVLSKSRENQNVGQADDFKWPAGDWLDYVGLDASG
jgi:hypothetical protein